MSSKQAAAATGGDCGATTAETEAKEPKVLDELTVIKRTQALLGGLNYSSRRRVMSYIADWSISLDQAELEKCKLAQYGADINKASALGQLQGASLQGARHPLNDKHFMVDIESTGVHLADDRVLEIGIVEMDLVDGFWQPGREFHAVLSYSGEPKSEFAKKHMAALYARCNLAPQRKAVHVRQDILDFFKSCGKVGHQVLLCGWNAANFDVPMLQAHGYLVPPGYATDPETGKDREIGDHHYRIYEMCGALQYAADVFQAPYPVLKDAVKDLYPSTMPEGKDHDAIYDCHKQIRLLNSLIKYMRERL